MNESQKAIALTILPQISEAASNPPEILQSTPQSEAQPQAALIAKRPTDFSHHERAFGLVAERVIARTSGRAV